MKSLSRTILILGLVSFFTDISSEMIYPLLPLFLSNVLGASALAIGLIEGIAEATSSIVKIISGIWTDKTQKRKPFILGGYTIAGLSRPLIGLAQSWPTVLLLRFTDRVGKGLRSAPRDALIADVTHEDKRGAAYGFHRAMDHAGAVVGPLVASLLLKAYGVPLRTVFLIAGIPAFLGLLVLFFGIKDRKPLVAEQASLPFSPIRDWGKLGKDFKYLLAAVLIFTLGNAADAFLLLRLSQSGLAEGWIAGLWAAHHIVKMASSFWGGRLSDKLGPRTLILAGWFLYSATYLAFGLLTSTPSLVIVFLIYGIHFGLIEPSERALISAKVPAHLRGSAFGYFYSITGIGALPASLLFGFLWQNWGPPSAFFAGSALSLFAALLLFKLNNHRRDLSRELSSNRQ